MFKLINFFDFPHLNQLRSEMQAPAAKYFQVSNKISLMDEESIRRLGKEGIEVNFDEIVALKDKTLGYKDQRVLLYIRDVMQYQNHINLPRFHVAYCQKLEEMRKNGRWARYVVANRVDGYFQVCINNTFHKSEMLNVCQYCLETLKWSNFPSHRIGGFERKRIVNSFSIAAFFSKYPKSLFSIIPTYTSDTAPTNTYSDDWPLISEKLKQERGYKCDSISCGIVLSGKDKKYLHVHHKNGLKNDNSKANLSVLCFRCHADEPFHSHMKSIPGYEDFLSRFDTNIYEE